MNQCTSKDINVLTWPVIILIHCWKSMLSWIELPVPSVCAATFCWINWVRCSNVRQWKSNRHAKIPMDKHTQKWFQQVCKVHILIKIKTELHHLILHFIQCAFRCMANFPTHASVASDYLPRDQTVPHIGRILFCMQCFVHIWQVFLILFINFMFQAMSCCEPLGNSWGKDSKLLCSICVFRLSQGRKFHQLFQIQKNLTKRLLSSDACCCWHSWWIKAATVLFNPHSALGTLLAGSCGHQSSRGGAVTFPVFWLLVGHRKCRNVIAIATCQPLGL